MDVDGGEGWGCERRQAKVWDGLGGMGLDTGLVRGGCGGGCGVEGVVAFRGVREGAASPSASHADP